jgi:hypothetical protein
MHPPTTTTLLATLINALRAHATPLSKREDSEYIIPKPVIILLIMLGSGLCVCIGFAIHSTYGFRADGNDHKEMTPEQMEYMTEVRVRNMQKLMVEGATHHKGPVRGDVVYN